MDNRFVPVKTNVQKEALLNEIKGNLFEYLVGMQLARIVETESIFLLSLKGAYKSQLLDYQKWIYENRPELTSKLSLLSASLAREISLLKRFKPFKGGEVHLLGKYAATGDQKKNWGETDLLILKNEETLPISIKLCKGNAYVNTKSGGVRSFITKYFANIQEANKWQEQLNTKVDEEFYKMGHQLYEYAGLSFSGSFDDNWEQSGYSSLPGELPDNLNEIVVNTYHEIAKVLYQALQSFFQDSLKSFRESLMPLVGMGKENMLQATCFHKVSKGSSYELESLKVHSFDQMLDEIVDIKFPTMNKKISSFEIELPSLFLQVRIKPMNKFTTNGIKVNCSVKYKKEKKD